MPTFAARGVLDVLRWLFPKQTDFVSPTPFGFVQGQVGLGRHHVGIFQTRKTCDTATERGSKNTIFVRMVYLAEIFADAVHDAVRIVQPRAVKNNRKFLATVASDNVAFANALTQHFGQAFDDTVSNRVPVLVVNFVEVIDVKHGKRHRGVVALGKHDGLGQMLLDARVIE